ncbi:MAG: bifunctional riboflavin kinase/FAD synthetase [Burkholderiaceae bacterium]
MEVFRRLPPPARRQPCALTIGNFDGVHLGHQAILARLRRRADELGLPACVLTFEPHPRDYFAARAAAAPAAGPAAPVAPARIYTQRDKLEALAACGVDRVCIAHFNASLAALPAEQFIERILIDGLHARYLLVGDDFRFGAARRGDFAMLQAAAVQHGFELARTETILDDGVRVSSSAVRAALAAGDFARARQLLGGPYFISGRVIHGRKLGRTIGFPTLNLRIPFVRPAVSGIFVVRVHGVHAAPLPGVASLGTRPAVASDGRLLLEVHLFDFNENLYGRRIRVEFLHKLRDEADFPSLAALTAQIERDAQAARRWFAAQAPATD